MSPISFDISVSLSHQFVGFELVCFKRTRLSTSFKLMARVWGGWISVVLVADSSCTKMHSGNRKTDLGQSDISTRLKVA